MEQVGDGGEPGSGPGDCRYIPEPFDDLYTDAGTPNYAGCHGGDQYYLPCGPGDCVVCGRCRPGDCVDDAREQELVDTIQEIAAARSYPRPIEFAQVVVDDTMSRAAFLVTVDWLKFRVLVHVSVAEVGVVDEQDIADQMPQWIPSAMPPIEDVWAAVRTCDADAQPYFCFASSNLRAHFVGECGLADLSLWDFNVVGSGMGEVTCSPSDSPCCTPSFP